MIEIISGTDRPGARTEQVSKLIHGFFNALKVKSQIMDLAKLPLHHLHGSSYKTPDPLQEAVSRVNAAEGLVMVIPEYNGSFPGALKHFIDHWKFPDSFEARPIAFVGLGGRFGGLRAVEQMQQVFSYRNGYLFPIRVFLTNVQNILKDGVLEDQGMLDLLKTQTRDFAKFIKALESQGLDANSLAKAKKP
jgi:chromate reductase, NAD(P)H dehydrogenase (quinone)